MNSLLISQLGLNRETLTGETIIITSALGGIGFEAARALLWLGANVIIAEIDSINEQHAEEGRAAEFDEKQVYFVQTDVGDEASIENLHTFAIQRYV
jgi:NAD(P)-dependent dehydrogenase (short-subunit alcohol dehydrogenase family)